jgi:hypothetical protein
MFLLSLFGFITGNGAKNFFWNRSINRKLKDFHDKYGF